MGRPPVLPEDRVSILGTKLRDPVWSGSSNPAQSPNRLSLSLPSPLCGFVALFEELPITPLVRGGGKNSEVDCSNPSSFFPHKSEGLKGWSREKVD